VADPYSPSEATSARGSAVASYGRRPAANGYPATDYSRDSLARKDSGTYQTGPYNTGPVSSGTASPKRDRYLREPTPEPYGSRDLPSRPSRDLPADRWSQQTTYAADQGAAEPRDTEAFPQRGLSNSMTTYGSGEPERYATSGQPLGERYDTAPPESSNRASSYAGTVDSTPSGYYGQPPAPDNDADRSMAVARGPEPYSRRDLTADPYDDVGSVRIADHRADARYDSPQHTPERGESAGPPERSVEPWRPGSTGDYPVSQSNAESGRYPSASPDRGTAAPAGYSADNGSYTR
jgi:hypothetical protein